MPEGVDRSSARQGPTQYSKAQKREAFWKAVGMKIQNWTPNSQVEAIHKKLMTGEFTIKDALVIGRFSTDVLTRLGEKLQHENLPLEKNEQIHAVLQEVQRISKPAKKEALEPSLRHMGEILAAAFTTVKQFLIDKLTPQPKEAPLQKPMKEEKLERKIREDLQKVFPEEMKEIGFDALVSKLWDEMPADDKTKETRLYASEDKAKLKMVRRFLAYKLANIDESVSPSLAKRMEHTGYDLSAIKAIEKIIKKQAAGQQEEIVDLADFTIRLIFFTNEAGARELITQGDKAGAGSFKTVRFTDFFFSMRTPEIESRRYVSKELTDATGTTTQQKAEVDKANITENAKKDKRPSSVEIKTDERPPSVEVHIDALASSEVKIEEIAGAEVSEVPAWMKAGFEPAGTGEVPRDVSVAMNPNSFEKEIEITLELKDVPGIMHIHKVIELQSGKKIILEEAAGYVLPDTTTKLISLQSLRQFIQASGRSDLQPILNERFAQALDALVEMHDKGWMHRDIKDENILLRKDGTAAITDFGTACKKDDETKDITGTDTYLAPESGINLKTALGKNITDKADVWSAAVMIAGTENHPFLQLIQEINPMATGMGLFMLIGSFTTDEEKQSRYESIYPEPPNKDSLEHLLWEATRIDPEKRPSMKQFRDRYRDIIRGMGVRPASL